MILNFSKASSIWEALAGALIAQQRGDKFFFRDADGEDVDWVLQHHAGLARDLLAEDIRDLQFDSARASRIISAQDTDASYVETLAAMSGVSFPTTMPLLRVPDAPYSDGNYIVLALGDVHQDFKLSVTAVRALLRLAKTYAKKIYIIGDPVDRPAVALMESELLFQNDIAKKQEILANAGLIIGTPNNWTWMASAWRKKMIVLYADSQPMKKWFPFADRNFGRVLLTPGVIDVVKLIAGVRVLISML